MLEQGSHDLELILHTFWSEIMLGLSTVQTVQQYYGSDMLWTISLMGLQVTLKVTESFTDCCGTTMV